MKRQRGVTMIELMIALVIIAILAAVAYPSYTSYVQKTNRAECAGGLLELAQAMERDFSANNTYRDIIGAGLFTDACPIDGGTATYGLAVTAAGASSYTLRATPSAANPRQSNDPCGWLQIDSTGAKTSQNLTFDLCWHR